MAEGAPLLREYGVLSLIKGSNPFVSASYSMNTPLSGRFLFLPTLLPTLLFSAGYYKPMDLDLDLIGGGGS